MARKIFALILIFLAIIIPALVFFINSHKSNVPVVFSKNEMLQALWLDYKKNYIETSSGRAFDKQKGNISTSEAQGYVLLRAVWMDDKGQFDMTWTWTKNNLQHKNDHLFAWLFGKRSDGTYGVLTATGGQNSASDADTDIALSLIFAFNRWGDTNYLVEAKNIIGDIWRQEVVQINGKPYLAADNMESTEQALVIINPSYLNPYAYRIFSKYDYLDNWQGLLSTSYSVLGTSIDSKLDKKKSAKLPPDWIAVNTSTGAVIPAAEKNPSSSAKLDSNFGFDAIRVPWRLELDYLWFKDTRDKDLLDRMGFLASNYAKNGRLDSIYGHDGKALTNTEDPALYGAVVGYFMNADAAQAADLYDQKIKSLYDPDKLTFKEPLNYYEANWVWFGIALYTNSLPNLAT